MSQSWKPLDLPIVTIGKAIQIWLEPSRQGRLSLTARKQGFPQGELYFILSNWPQTRHWLVPAQLEGEVLRGDLRGSACAFSPLDDRPVLVSLGLRDGEGLIRYPLQAGRLKKMMSDRARCLYFHDERSWFSGPVDSFTFGPQVYETLPRYVRTIANTVVLALAMTPRSLRYWEQLRCGLTGLERRGTLLHCTAVTPTGAPALAGISIHPLDGTEGEQRFYPVDQYGVARIPVNCLPMDGRAYGLSGVCHQEGDILFHVPLSVLDGELHRRLEALCNATPLRRSGDLACWLRLDELCTPTLQAGYFHPDSVAPIADMTLEEAAMSERLPVEGRCCVDELGGGDWTLRLAVPNLTLEGDFCVRAERKREQYLLPASALRQGQDTLLTIDLQILRDQAQNSRMVRWYLTLAYEQDGRWFHRLLRCPSRMVRRNLDVDPEYLDYTRCFSRELGRGEMGDHEISCLLNCSAAGHCRIQIQDAVKAFELQLVTRVDEAVLERNVLRMRLRCPALVPGKWWGIVLHHRFKLEADRQLIYIPARKLRQEGQIWHMEVEADLSAFHFLPLYWDIRAVFQGEDGERYLVRALSRRKKQKLSPWERRRRRLRRLFHPGSYRQGLDWSVSLYRTAKFGYALVCQEYSPYSGLAFRLKERLALAIHKVFRKPLAKKSIFLVYEKYCCMAQDNGYYFFRYCMEQNMEQTMGRSIYFVIDKRQPDYRERLLPYKGHVIQFMSLKHMVYLLAARLLISSDSKAHAYAWRAKESIILPRIEKRKKLVFLQHGVIALKRVEFYAKGTNAVNLFVTSNQREHDIIVREMAYPDEDVIITGLARWDVLQDRGLQEKRILVMPTWRNWLEEVSDTAFMTSDYYRNYMALLNDPAMGRLLEQYDLYLDFYIHPKFRDYIANFTIQGGSRVRLIPFGQEPLNQLIMGCKLLITDYSSVCWDVYYQGKPVLFYQFDVDQYNETTGSYIDMETELFGERALDPATLLALLEQYAKTDFALPERFAEMRPHMYAYLDHNNSQRICEEIMKRHW